MKIPINQIIPDPDQPRKTFKEETLGELKESYQKLGLIQPITVRPYDGKYQIVIGERRYRASLLNGQEEIECIVREDIDDKTAREMQFAENYHIAPLEALEQAEAWVKHIEQFDMTKVEFAKVVGVNEGTVKQNVTMVTNLAPELLEATRKGNLMKSYAEVIAPLESKNRQIEIAKPIIEGKIGGYKTFEYISKAKENPSLSPETIAIQVVYNSNLHKTNGQAILNELKKQQILNLPPPQGKYRGIIIDPPWSIEKILRDARPNQFDIDYPTMTLEEIMALPIPDLADDNGCHIYLWTTHKHLHDALHILEAWGAEYQCLMTWVKNVGFTPFSWMYSTEHCLFGHIGSLPLLKLGKRLDFQAKVREHSRKPDEFYDLVREVSPKPIIDYFAREKREGIEAWGNETSKFQEAEVVVT